MAAQLPSDPSANPAKSLVFLKLGGSLITDKTKAESARKTILQRLADEIQQARQEAPNLGILLGHGSGSFGHVAARRYGTRAGVLDAPGWMGFVQVAHAAARLNRLVVTTFLEAGIPVWSIQPSASACCADGQLIRWDASIVKMALDRDLLPLVYGDTVLDVKRGGTIASTEELFAWLAMELQPTHIILTGTVDGVFADDPILNPQAEHWPEIRVSDLPRLRASLGGSHGVDVTGGMLSKVNEMCQLVTRVPGLHVRLISGQRPGAVYKALLNQPAAGGTVIR